MSSEILRDEIEILKDEISSEIIRDESYYMKYAIFLVEDTHFRVPTMVLEEESEVFEHMFTLPPSPGEEVEGQSDDKPIRLEGVKKEEFRNLLKFLYPGQRFAAPQFTTEEWVHILDLSERWGMASVRDEAIPKIYKTQRCLPHSLLTLGKRFDIEDWIFNGVDMLVRRARPLNAEDVQLIGMDEALKIASIRECCSAGYGVEEQRGQIPQRNKIDERIKVDYDISSTPTIRSSKLPK